MIGHLTGKIVTCSPGHVLLVVTGVGYNLHIPLSTFYTLSSGGNASVILHVHTHVREEALQLYGFARLEERSAFERLISISGVGPRLALAILSGIGVDELRAAVESQLFPRFHSPARVRSFVAPVLAAREKRISCKFSGE